jgi:putative acetyltransferase
VSTATAHDNIHARRVRMHAMELEIGVDNPERTTCERCWRGILHSRGKQRPRCTPSRWMWNQLVDPTVTFFSARDAARLVGVAALKRLDQDHAELKSMHTSEAERGRGIGRALVEHILAFARAAGHRRVSLETGATDEFVPARTLYAKIGFMSCGAFGNYRTSPYNTFMTMTLGPAADRTHD